MRNCFIFVNVGGSFKEVKMAAIEKKRFNLKNCLEPSCFPIANIRFPSFKSSTYQMAKPI